ncbi:cation diffusion facilitator family transporter (plasmid) [Pseudarthrobacter phenanthrenivorans Sphe3]|uniref:Cation diffusion facilitator family transporter n=1 Tax=Pseudarthrobacter phenanthrenivorans (strain DSM 18606 / JCM 16027 / LMG 23796 / Sphe3) TaxID=930171 RepID=F0MCC2_PSEPM|nr:cation diffusion facilitator family transporter [Pseudarthrobacter phenanthrenivorans]ADX75173.1 cation diffusion facilitator family transporter [Pseudarthrobacter phenanthrenivorans Sphe3]
MSGHSHDHAGSGAGQRGKLIIVFAITFAVMVAEIVGALLTGSLALLADAGHMFTDSAGLLIALIAASLALKPATLKRTWGYKRAEIIAAAFQAALLLGVGGFVIVEGIRRFFEPPEIAGSTMLWFGVIGLAGNAVGLIVLASGRNHNFNMKAAFLEVLNDALGSVAVIVAAIVIALTGWVQADAVVSLLIGVLIIPRTLKLLRDTVNVLMENAPAGLDLGDVRDHILALPHVIDVHDLHASLVGSGTPVLSAHVTVEDGCMTDGHAATILADLQRCVAEHFDVSVEHSTFQIEPASHRDQESIHH